MSRDIQRFLLTTEKQILNTSSPATVEEVLVEEFLKPLSMSNDELAEAMGGGLGRMLGI
mgnify:CR=1 FL=1